MATQAKSKTIFSDGLNDQSPSPIDNTATDAGNNVALQVVYSTVTGVTENTDGQVQAITQENSQGTETPNASEEVAPSDVETAPNQEIANPDTDNASLAPDAGTENTVSNESAQPTDEVVDTQDPSQSYSLVLTNVVYPATMIEDSVSPETIALDDADPTVPDPVDTAISDDTTVPTEVADQEIIDSPDNTQTYSCVFTLVNFDAVMIVVDPIDVISNEEVATEVTGSDAATLISLDDINLNASERVEPIDVEITVFEGGKLDSVAPSVEIATIGFAITIGSVYSYF